MGNLWHTIASFFLNAIIVLAANACQAYSEGTCGTSADQTVMMQKKVHVNAEHDYQKLIVVDGIGRNQQADRPITFITVVTAKDRGFFDHNLAKSQLWNDREKLPHQWLVYENTYQLSISSIYSHETQRAHHDLIVYLHPDVLLPDTWYKNCMEELAKIEAIDPKWGALGTAGVYLDWKPGKVGLKIQSVITDAYTTYFTSHDRIEMQSLDEHFLMLRRNGSVRFDPGMPGFDLYGSDIVLTARKEGLKCYLLHTPLQHKVFDVDGSRYLIANFMSKVNSTDYIQRVNKTLTYLQGKWNTSGLLPTYGSAYDITVPKC